MGLTDTNTALPKLRQVSLLKHTKNIMSRIILNILKNIYCWGLILFKKKKKPSLLSPTRLLPSLRGLVECVKYILVSSHVNSHSASSMSLLQRSPEMFGSSWKLGGGETTQQLHQKRAVYVNSLSSITFLVEYNLKQLTFKLDSISTSDTILWREWGASVV